ncbi:hypothetical protein A7325_04980 [Psychrobacter sp. SHUES1]|nr:hypothetical protein A7325_04980 [Psychrobacter sp. SHUES1]
MVVIQIVVVHLIRVLIQHLRIRIQNLQLLLSLLLPNVNLKVKMYMSLEKVHALSQFLMLMAVKRAATNVRAILLL